MAYIGLAKPLIAEYDATTKKYTGGFACGKAISVALKPSWVEGSLDGDDEQVLYEKHLKYIDVTLGTTSLPIAAASTIFGHTVKEKETTYSTTDEANYVGMAYYTTEKDDDGTTSYMAVFMPKVKFGDSDESYTTKGDKIEFSTPSISGRATSLDGVYKDTQTFATIDAAVTWMNTKLDITTT